MPYMPLPVDNSLDKDGIVRSSKYLYGCKQRDHSLLHSPVGMPRYAHLARKALLHYAGDRYNPHTIDVSQEIFVRGIIKSLVEHKVMNRLKGYDWEYIDNFLKKIVSDYYELNLSYDLARIEQGFAPEFRPTIAMNFDQPT